MLLLLLGFSGSGVKHGELEGWSHPALPGYGPGVVGGATGVGVLWGPPPSGEGPIPMVVEWNLDTPLHPLISVTNAHTHTHMYTHTHTPQIQCKYSIYCSCIT